MAARVMRRALEEGVAEEERIRGLGLEGLLAFVQGRFWEPKYLPYRPASGNLEACGGFSS